MSVWWEKITSASNIIKDTVESINTLKSVILSVPESVPEYEELESKIFGEIALCNKATAYIDGTASDDPERTLFNDDQFLDGELRMQFRPTPGRTKTEFLANCNAELDNYIVVVKNAGKEWIDFVNNYNSAVKDENYHGVFLLIAKGFDGHIQSKRRVTRVAWEDYITTYDYTVFCMLRAEGIKASKLMKEYIADITSGIGGESIELCDILLSYGMRLAEDVYTVLDEIKREHAELIKYIASNDDITKIVWMSQVKMIFPIIEDYRREFINRHRREIEGCLPIKGEYIEYTEADEVEIGALHYHIINDIISASAEEADKIKFYRNVRNELAHVTSIDYERLKRIL